MEVFCSGGTVLKLLKQHRMLEPEAAGNVLGCVVHGLKVCHNHNILVRALAPENLFIDSTGIVKLANFEFGKKIMPGEFTMTVCGSKEYMSPEQMYGHGQTLASDFWGLGCLMYELMCGTTPFADPSEDIHQVHSNVLQGITDRILHDLGENAGHLGEDLCKGLLNSKAEDRTGNKDWHDLEHHHWFVEYNVNMGDLNTGHYGANTKVFWKPTIDNNKVGAYYYNDDDHPLSLHDEIHHNGATQYGGHLNEGEETSGNSTDLPWHWVFGE